MRTVPTIPPPGTDPQWQRWSAYVGTLRAAASPVPFVAQWARFGETYADRPPELGPPPAWQPSPERIARSNLGRFMHALGIDDYAALHAWSVAERAAFWERVIERLGIVFARRPRATLDLAGDVTRPRWLPGAALNAAASCFRAAPDAIAVLSAGESSPEIRRTTYGELHALAARFAAGLRAHGIAPGEGVALCMPMTLECVAAYLGTVLAGCYVVSIADSFAAGEVRRRLEIGGARTIVTVDRFRRGGKTIALYARICEAGAPPAIVVRAGGGDARAPGAAGGDARAPGAAGGDPTPPGAAGAPGPRAADPLRDGDLDWRDFLGGEAAFPAIACDPAALTNVLFSSGTTGTPKAIPWTHLTPIKCVMDGHFHQDIQPGDVVAWPTNIGWMMGPWLIYAALVNRATLALYDGAPTGAAFARFVAAAGVTMLGVVPSLVRAWREAGACDGADWSGVRLFSSTGEPSSREDYLWLMSRTGYRAPVIEYCGGTEIGGGYLTGTVVQPASPATFTTPALGLDLVTLDPAGQPVAPGEMGEVFLLPPSIGLSERLLNADHEAIYHTGSPPGPHGAVLRRHGDQLARLHGGYFRAQGRADDTMNLGGVKVASLELERVVDAHPAILESAAIAVQPAGEGAEKLVVCVVLKETVAPAGGAPASGGGGDGGDGGDTDDGKSPAGGDDGDTHDGGAGDGRATPPDLQALRVELGRRLARHLNPLFKIHDLIVLDQLPRTASNKLMRRALRARYAELRASRRG